MWKVFFESIKLMLERRVCRSLCGDMGEHSVLDAGRQGLAPATWKGAELCGTQPSPPGWSTHVFLPPPSHPIFFLVHPVPRRATKWRSVWMAPTLALIIGRWTGWRPGCACSVFSVEPGNPKLRQEEHHRMTDTNIRRWHPHRNLKTGTQAAGTFAML